MILDKKQNRYFHVPFLMAVYEFLLGMEGYEFHSTFNEILDGIRQNETVVTSVKTASNALSAHLRKYRIAHMSWAKNHEKFDRIYPFLRDRSENECPRTR